MVNALNQATCLVLNLLPISPMKKLLSLPAKLFKSIWSNKLKFLGLLIVILILGFVIFTKTRPKPEEFTLVNPQRGNIKQTLELAGKIEAGDKAVLHFQSGGKLTWVCCKQGDRVEKYHAIASLDKVTLKKTLERKLNDYLISRWSFEENRDQAGVTDFDLNLFSLSDTLKRSLETDQFNLNKAVIDVELQDIANQLAIIYSPIAGVLINTTQDLPGVNVSVTDSWTVVDPDSLYFEAEVDEVDVGAVKTGQTVEINLDAFPDRTINSSVSSVDFAASPGSSGGTVFKIRFSLTPGELDYRLGFNGDANIILAEKQDILTIPVDSLIERDDQTFVKVSTNHRQEDRQVQIGIRDDNYVEITSGLTPDDQVVLPQAN